MNRLSTERSAYLKESAKQPVHWWPWCDQAFEAAKNQKKLILVDVGASWCHWCHVMDKENYEAPSTAQLINTFFIAIKVDRDERPDIDRRLQDAVASLTGQGGWPLTVILTPEGKPFFGGTYFPPTPRYGMPSFRQVIEHALEQFRNHYLDIEHIGDTILHHFSTIREHTKPSVQNNPGIISSYSSSILALWDKANGGFGMAPKFPNPETILFLLHQYELSKDESLLSCAEDALIGMACGGIHDHVGGGFHRYSTDPQWKVPHFELMLSENAMLLRCYVQAFRITAKPIYKDVCLGILRWILDEMHDPNTGFFASQDADFKGEEGGYFVWTHEEMVHTLGNEDVNRFLEAFELEPIEDGIRNILIRKKTELPLSPFLILCLEKLHALRKQRGQAPTDTTVYTNWNCLAAIACLEAGMILHHPKATKAGLTAIENILTARCLNGIPMHSPHQIEPLYSDDAVMLCHALITAYDSTIHWNYIKEAGQLADSILSQFQHEHTNGLIDSTQTRLDMPHYSYFDFAQPATNPLFVICLLKLATYLEREDYQAQAEVIISNHSISNHATNIGSMALHASTLMTAMQMAVEGIEHIVLIAGSNIIQPFLDCYHGSYSIFRSIMTQEQSDHALLTGKHTIDGKTTAYLCKGTTCETPITKPEELWKALMI